MHPRVVELELEVADWMEQLYTAQFATTAFFIGLLTAYGGLLLPPAMQRIGDRLSQVNLLRLFLGTEPAGLTYCCAPGRRTVLLTVWRGARLPTDFETQRATHALRSCAGHRTAEHRSWTELEERRMREPGAAETRQDAARAYEFGRMVHLRRQRHGLGTAELAVAADTTEDVIVRCEAGGLPPLAPVATRIADALRAIRYDDARAEPTRAGYPAAGHSTVGHLTSGQPAAACSTTAAPATDRRMPPRGAAGGWPRG
jgi:ribosome-binding protein aMBF1 (putative translation factor)